MTTREIQTICDNTKNTIMISAVYIMFRAFCEMLYPPASSSDNTTFFERLQQNNDNKTYDNAITIFTLIIEKEYRISPVLIDFDKIMSDYRESLLIIHKFEKFKTLPNFPNIASIFGKYKTHDESILAWLTAATFTNTAEKIEMYYNVCLIIIMQLQNCINIICDKCKLDNTPGRPVENNQDTLLKYIMPKLLTMQFAHPDNMIITSLPANTKQTTSDTDNAVAEKAAADKAAAEKAAADKAAADKATAEKAAVENYVPVVAQTVPVVAPTVPVVAPTVPVVAPTVPVVAQTVPVVAQTPNSTPNKTPPNKTQNKPKPPPKKPFNPSTNIRGGDLSTKKFIYKIKKYIYELYQNIV